MTFCLCLLSAVHNIYIVLCRHLCKAMSNKQGNRLQDLALCLRHLTIILRARVGYETVDSPRGEKRRVGDTPCNNREWLSLLHSTPKPNKLLHVTYKSTVLIFSFTELYVVSSSPSSCILSLYVRYTGLEFL